MSAGSRRTWTLLPILLCCTTLPTWAGNPTQFYRSLLPPLCQAATGSGQDGNKLPSQELARGNAIKKSGCGSLSNYCRAMESFIIYHFPDKANLHEPTYYLYRGIGELESFLESAQKGCTLLPEAYTALGTSRIEHGDLNEAERAFRKALGLKPDHAPAYVGLSDLYETQGSTDKARAVLEAGLKANPQSKALKKKLERLLARTNSASHTP